MTESAPGTASELSPAPANARTVPFDPELSYPEWLLGHEDSSLIDFLRRLHSIGAIDALAPTPLDELGAAGRGGARGSAQGGLQGGALGETLGSSIVDSSALNFLSAIELLVLHSGYELDAATEWVSAADIFATATELLDIAGTPPGRRPKKSELLEAMGSCASWGFIYGSQWSLDARDGATETDRGETPPVAGTELDPAALMLRLPPPLATMFYPTVKELWRLADCNRCPIPTAELPKVVEAVPDRQRRLLSTLSNAGGVGHSQSLKPGADPDQPLPTLVRQGILDQIDENTARLTGRVAQYIRGHVIGEPGGDFRPNLAPAELPTAPDGAESQADRGTTATAVANVVQTVQDISELLEDLGVEPIQPLVSGGIGVREMNRFARAWGSSQEEVERRLTLAYLAGLIDLGFAHPSAGDGPVWGPTEKALDFLESGLDTQWAMLLLGWRDSPYSPWLAEELEARVFEDALLDGGTAQLRLLFPSLFHTPSGGMVAAGDAAAQLWRVRPHQAWHTSEVALEALKQEAEDFGMTAQGAPTAALAALRDTPRGQDPGDCMTHLSEALRELLPEPVRYLIIQADHTIMAPGLLAPEDAAMLRAIAEQESSGMASVWRISLASVQGALQRGREAAEVASFLEKMTPGGAAAIPESIRYLIEDAERAVRMGRGTEKTTAQASHSLHRVPERGRRKPRTRQLEEALAAEVESYRRAAGEAEEDRQQQENTLTDPQAAMNALKQAYASGHQVHLVYANSDGSTESTWVSVVMVTPTQITAVTEPEGTTLTVHPHRVVAVKVPAR